MAEVIEDRQSGMLVRAADSGALAQALRELLDSPDTRTAIGIAARRRAVTNFSMEAMARRTLALYQSTLAEN